MSDLTKIEKIKLERFLEMGTGHILDFESNKKFEDFVLENIEVDIYEDKYATTGSSKAKRLRVFWEMESNEIVAKLLGYLFEYRKKRGFRGSYAPKDDTKHELEKVCNDILLRLNGKNQANTNSHAVKNIRNNKFKVAFSFSGNNREYVLKLKNELQSKLKKNEIFYDDDYVSQLAAPNLDILLQNIYQKQSKLIVLFLCEKYEEKEWCKLEWRSIRDIIKTRDDECIMPLRFDDTKVPGLFSIDGYIDLQKYSYIEVANLIYERLLSMEVIPA